MGLDLEAASSGVQSPKNTQQQRKKGLVKRPFNKARSNFGFSAVAVNHTVVRTGTQVPAVCISISDGNGSLMSIRWLRSSTWSPTIFFQTLLASL